MRRQRSFLDAKPGEKVEKISRFPDPVFPARRRRDLPRASLAASLFDKTRRFARNPGWNQNIGG